MPSSKPSRSRARSKRSATRRGAPQGPRFPVVLLAIGVVVILGIVAIVLSTGGDDGQVVTEAGVEQTRPVTISGDSLPPAQQGADAAAGELAPEIQGATFTGTPLSIEVDGRPKVLVFLAHWCPHCQREVPVLAEWLTENGEPDDVDVYGVATATTPDRPNFPPSVWLEDEDWRFPTLVDDAEGSTATAFGLSGFPFFVVLDADHQVVARTSGEISVEQWEQLINLAAAG